MFRTALVTLGAAFTLALISSPAYAPTPVLEIPEPSSLVIMSTGVITVLGVYAIRKWFKNK
jgi:hypothetical protein